jgi:hypothetical protein
MKISIVAIGLTLTIGVATFPVHADVYRCTQPDGKNAYQETPCVSGSQKTVDDSQTKARERVEAQKRQDAEAVERDLRQVRWCIADKACESFYYARLLNGKRMSAVLDILGEPQTVQNIGGREIHYFTVPTTDGRKSAKLQITYAYGKVETVNTY